MRDLSRAIGYCRVSTQRQVTDGHGLERYIFRLKEFGLTDDNIYYDIESGDSETRAGYNRVLDLVRCRAVDTIIVPCFDRFTRSALGWEKARAELQEYNVELQFLDGGSLDLETPEGLFTSRILAAMAAQLRDKNKYNALQGAKYFREKKKIYQAIFGFVKVGETVEPNREEYRSTGKSHAAIAVEAIQIFISTGEIGGTIRKLVEKYGVERVSHLNYKDFPRDISAFKRWLLNPQLWGGICYYPTDSRRKIIVKSEHEGIISESDHEEVLRLLKKPVGQRKKKRKNPLANIAICGVCGNRLEFHSYDRIVDDVKKSHQHLRCLGAYNKPGKPQVCDNRKYYRLEDAIAFACKQIQLASVEIAKRLDVESSPRKETIEILELKQQISQLKALNDPDLDPVIRSKEFKLSSAYGRLEIENQVQVGNVNYLEAIKGLFSLDKDWIFDIEIEELCVLFPELIESFVCSPPPEGKSPGGKYSKDSPGVFEVRLRT